MRTIVLFVLLSLFLVSFGEGIMDITLKSDKHGPFKLSEIKKFDAAVFIFLSPECPLSQNYTLTINQLYDSLHGKNVELYAVFPGVYYSKKEVRSFKKRYKLSLPILYDTEYKLARELQASVTPECFLVEPANGKTIYSGAIDNWAISLGKQRKTATENYLSDAISDFLNNTKVEVIKTEAIGCFLELK